MSNEAIPLAKHELNLDRMEYPAFLSEKMDGVPVRFSILCYESGKIFACAQTRQWETTPSVQYYLDKFVDDNELKFVKGYEYTFVWEVTHEKFTGFKDISGVVRRQSPQTGLVFNLFDYDHSLIGCGSSGVEFSLRKEARQFFNYTAPTFNMIPQRTCIDKTDLEMMLLTPMRDDQEGWVIRAGSAAFKPGTRHWDYQVVVKEPTIDLWIVGAEEGKGKFEGGVGKFIALYKGEKIGIGPGKQTTRDREVALQAFQSGCEPRMAKIKYKPDAGYTALRQPTFQCWRDDKTEADA